MLINNMRIFFRYNFIIFIILVYILFDDVFEFDDNEDLILNRFVLEFVFLMNEVVRLLFFFFRIIVYCVDFFFLIW